MVRSIKARAIRGPARSPIGDVATAGSPTPRQGARSNTRLSGGQAAQGYLSGSGEYVLQQITARARPGEYRRRRVDASIIGLPLPGPARVRTLGGVSVRQ